MSYRKGARYPLAEPYIWESNYHGPDGLGKYLKPYGYVYYHNIQLLLPFGPISSPAKLDFKTMQWSWDVDLSLPFVDLLAHIRYAHSPAFPRVFIVWNMVDLAGGTFEATYRLDYDTYVWVAAGGSLGNPVNLVVGGGFDATPPSLGVGFAFYHELPP